MLRQTLLRDLRTIQPRGFRLGRVGIRSAPLISTTQFKSVRYNSTGPSTSEVVSQISDSLQSFSSDAVETTSRVIGEASQHIGYMNSVGLAQSWWWPPDLIQHVLEYVHVYSGLPWWATIAVTTIGIRVLLFPLYVKASDNMARMNIIKPEIEKLTADYKKAYGDPVQLTKFNFQRKKVMNKAGVNSLWMIAPLAQFPVAIGMFAGLRSMALIPVDGLQNQGILWFTDLSAADPYLGLQCLTAAIFITFMRFGGETGANVYSPQMKRILTFLPLVSIPVTMSLSADIIVYFFVNGVLGLVQGLLLKSKTFRKLLKMAPNIPPPPSKTETKGFVGDLQESYNSFREKAEQKAEEGRAQELIKQKQIRRKENNNTVVIKRRRKPSDDK